MRRVLIWVALAAPFCSELPAASAEEDGVAVAIVYDTSGSMRQPVRAANGKLSPKYIIANRALSSIVDRIQTFATNSASGGGPRKVQAGLIIFTGHEAREAVKFGPFDPAPFRNWLKNYAGPDSATPLGTAVDLASRKLLNSGLTRKHLVVVTDGMNTIGPEPSAVIPRLKKEATRQNTDLSFHFVALDVDAKVFDPLKKLGAVVVGATDEKQLNTQLEFIFEKKILLEDEEPKPGEPKPK
jgi:hypothetical protein